MATVRKKQGVKIMILVQRYTWNHLIGFCLQFSKTQNFMVYDKIDRNCNSRTGDPQGKKNTKIKPYPTKNRVYALF